MASLDTSGFKILKINLAGKKSIILTFITYNS